MIVVPKNLAWPRVSFDPKGFKDARKQWEAGNPAKIIAMMQEAEVDSHVAGCLIGRRAGYKRAYSMSPWSEAAADVERKDWMVATLNGLDLKRLLQGIHQARMKFFSVMDFEWEIIDGQDVPISFKYYDQKHFRRDRDDDTLKVWDGRSLVEIPDEALVVENAEEEVPVMLPVLRDYILKEFGVQAWAAFMETWGAPFVMAKYPPGADDDFKSQVEKAVADIQSSSRGTAPEGTEFEVVSTDKSTGDHEKFVATANKGISIATLGHANAVEQSSGLQVGSNLDAFEVRFEIAVDDMDFIEPHVNRLIRMIYDRNATDGRYPRFQFSKSKPVNVQDHLRVIETAYRSDVIIMPGEWAKLGIELHPEQGPVQKVSMPFGE